jgi:pilus assembly protein Flp/PilA
MFPGQRRRPKPKLRRKTVKKKLIAFLRNEEGLTIVEYAVAAGLITAAVALSFTALGTTVNTVITTVTGYI